MCVLSISYTRWRGRQTSTTDVLLPSSNDNGIFWTINYSLYPTPALISRLESHKKSSNGHNDIYLHGPIYKYTPPINNYHLLNIRQSYPETLTHLPAIRGPSDWTYTYSTPRPRFSLAFIVSLQGKCPPNLLSYMEWRYLLTPMYQTCQ